jgi:hypothetical protein
MARSSLRVDVRVPDIVSGPGSPNKDASTSTSGVPAFSPRGAIRIGSLLAPWSFA